MKEVIKAPSTAKFASYSDSTIVTDGGWPVVTVSVISYVDAQNSFGAMLRQNFKVIVSYNYNTDKYTLLDYSLY